MLRARLSEAVARLSTSSRSSEPRAGAAAADAGPTHTHARPVGRLRTLLGRRAGERESTRAAGSPPAAPRIAPPRSAAVREVAAPAAAVESYSERSVLDRDFRGDLYVVRANDPSNQFVSLIRVTDNRSGAPTPAIAVGPVIDSWRGREPMTPFARQVMQDELRERISNGRSVTLSEAFPGLRFLQRDTRESSD